MNSEPLALFPTAETAALKLCAACGTRPAEIRNHCRACLARGEEAQTLTLNAGPDNPEPAFCAECGASPCAHDCLTLNTPENIAARRAMFDSFGWTW